MPNVALYKFQHPKLEVFRQQAVVAFVPERAAQAERADRTGSPPDADDVLDVLALVLRATSEAVTNVAVELDGRGGRQANTLLHLASKYFARLSQFQSL